MASSRGRVSLTLTPTPNGLACRSEAAALLPRTVGGVKSRPTSGHLGPGLGPLATKTAPPQGAPSRKHHSVAFPSRPRLGKAALSGQGGAAGKPSAAALPAPFPQGRAGVRAARLPPARRSLPRTGGPLRPSPGRQRAERQAGPEYTRLMRRPKGTQGNKAGAEAASRPAGELEGRKTASLAVPPHAPSARRLPHPTLRSPVRARV